MVRNRYCSLHSLPQILILNRASLVFAIQTWLAETPEQTRKTGTPSYLSVGMSGTQILMILALHHEANQVLA